MLARCIRTKAIAVIGMAMALLAADAAGLGAQGGGECELKVKPAPGKVGYRKRTYGCEGMYVGLQSAPVGVHVVSFVRGGLEFDTKRTQMIVRLGADSAIGSEVRVIGRALLANLNWAFDSRLAADTLLTWNLNEVIHAERLTSTTVGLHGVVVQDDQAGPSFVPVEIDSWERGAMSPSRFDTLRMIVRVPAAGALRWSLIKLGGAEKSPGRVKEEKPINDNADGFFEIKIPPLETNGDTRPRSGQHELVIEWRRQLTRMWGAPVRLRLYL